MSKTVIVTIATPENKTDFAAGTVAAGITVALSGGVVPPQTVVADSDSTIVTFADVPAGTYTLTTQTIDSNSQPLGAAITSAEFTVDADPATIRIPVSVSVQVQ